MASDEDEDKIVVLIPPSRGDYSLLRFQGDTTAGGVQVVDDDAVRGKVIELLHPGACIELHCDAAARFLTLHLEHIDSFCGVELDVADAAGRSWRIVAGNNRSTVRIRDDECTLPLVLKPGWNHVCLDIRDLAQRAFGVRAERLESVFVHARCRLWHAFLHNRPVLDPELPDSVRVIE